MSTTRKPRWYGEGLGPAQGYGTGLCFRPGTCILTLRNLCGQWRGDGDEVTLLAAIVDGHLAPLTQIVHVAVALVHELFQGEVPIHQHTCMGRRQQLVRDGDLRG